MRIFHALLTGMPMLLLPTLAAAEDFPSRTIRRDHPKHYAMNMPLMRRPTGVSMPTTKQ